MANIQAAFDVKNIANKDGTVHDDFRNWMEQHVKEIYSAISSMGFAIPQHPTDFIDTNLTPNSQVSSFVFDKTLNVYKGLVLNGSNKEWKTFQFS